MVFFVVSGLCIHLPSLRGDPIQWGPFFARRYLRLGMPLAAAWLIGALLVGNSTGSRVQGVIWSLVAELIYYTLYPGLLWCRNRWGWNRVLLGSITVSVITLSSSSQVLQPWLLPFWKIALGFLPAWLLGCILAEQVAKRTLPQASRLRCWALRGVIWLALMLSFASIFHLPAAIPPIRFFFSLLALAGVAWVWLRFELSNGQIHPPPRWLEWCGLWSYSLYLTHLDSLRTWGSLRSSLGFTNATTWLEAGLRVVWVLGLAILFYWIAELPAHRLARDTARKLSK